LERCGERTSSLYLKEVGFSIGVPSSPVAGSRGGAVKCETATRFQLVQQQYRCETMCAGCTNGVCVCVYDSMYLCAHTTASVYASACACDSAMPVCDYAEAVHPHVHVHVKALCLCATTQKQWPRAQPRMDGWAAYMIPAPPSRLANSAPKA